MPQHEAWLTGWSNRVLKRIAGGVSDLEQAVSEMEGAYTAFASEDFPEKFHPHREATLLAWRAGIEAAKTVKLGLENTIAIGLPIGVTDASLVIAVNRWFGVENGHQRDASRALQALG